MCVAALTLDLPTSNNLVVALGMVAYPVGDVTVSVVRRLLRAKPPLTADCSHVHHKVLAITHSPVRTVVLLSVFASVCVAAAVVLPGLAGLVALGALWAALLWAVVRNAHVRIGAMFRHRGFFRRIHATRRYLTTLLGTSRMPADVHRGVHLLAQQFDLAAVEFHEFRYVKQPERDGRVMRFDVRLREGVASWEYVPWGDDPALDNELQAVTGELLRAADRRLAFCRASAPPAPRSVEAAIVLTPVATSPQGARSL
jgi:hypothetical protein